MYGSEKVNNVFSKGNFYLERGVDVYIDLDYMCH